MVKHRVSREVALERERRKRERVARLQELRGMLGRGVTMDDEMLLARESEIRLAYSERGRGTGDLAAQSRARASAGRRARQATRQRRVKRGPYAHVSVNALLSLAAERRDLDARVAEAVMDAKRQRVTWDAVGEVFGISGEAARTRWGRGRRIPMVSPAVDGATTTGAARAPGPGGGAPLSPGVTHW